MTVLCGVTWDHPRGRASVEAAAHFYHERVPDVSVHWEARTLQQFATQPLHKLCARFDLVVIDHPHVALAAADGLLEPLDGAGFDEEIEAIGRASVGPSHDSYRYGGHQYALAIDAAVQVSVSRPDLVAERPGTWSDALELAKDGRVLWPAKPIDAYSSLLTLLAMSGQPAFPSSGTFADEAACLQVLEDMCHLAELVPPECLAQDPIDVAEALASDDAWLYSPLVFGYTNYSRPGFRGHRLRFHEAPAGPNGHRGSLLGGAGIAVSATSRHRAKARAHAVWLASAEVQRGPYFAGGGQPAHAEAWLDPALDRAALGFFSGTRRSMEGAWVRPAHPRYPEFQDAVAPLVTEVLARELTPETFLAEAERWADRMVTS